MKKISLMLALFIGTIGLAQAKKMPLPLGVILQASASYQCADKTRLDVRYYSLSDDSLGFVKVKLNGKTYTLPQAVSASGAKYSDDRYVTWWTKGDAGTVYEQNEEPEESWPATHEDCIKIKAKNNAINP